MAHVHAEEANVYYLDQICTIGLCGALSGVGILMWQQGLLQHILAPQFHLLVLAGSVAVLLLVVVRSVVLWQTAGKTGVAHEHSHTHEHEHSHTPEHEHSHAHEHGRTHEHGHHHHDHAGCHDHHHEPAGTTAACPPALADGCCAAPGHTHDHDHEHGWSPWRYMVLLLPVLLYLCGLPNQSFSPDKWKDVLANEQPENVGTVALAGRGDEVLPLEFTELKQAAFLPVRRAFYEGKTGRLLGQFMPGAAPNTCSLIRIKMVCCAADATPLNVVIVAPDRLPDLAALQWVEVTGQIQFRKRRDRDEFLPVLQIKGSEQIAPAQAPSNFSL